MKQLLLKITLLLTVLPAFVMAAEQPAKPNVIVILADDMGYADLGSQEVRKDLKTPNLDALAANGVRCTAGYITSPQCSPSRAGLITGCYQQRYGIDTIPDVPLPREAVTQSARLISQPRQTPLPDFPRPPRSTASTCCPI
jgi:arylsulfatase A-like enzyme